MENLSKATIFIPIVILLLAFGMRLTGSYSGAEKVAPTPSLMPTAVSQQPFDLFGGFNSSSTSAKLDLKGPLVCDYSSKEIGVNVKIKNRNISAVVAKSATTDNFLLKDDCFYKWNNVSQTGDKICGVGHYLSLVDSLPFLNFLNIETIFGFAKQIQPSLSISDQQAKDIAQTCKKEEINDTIFRIPNNITFEEKGTLKITPGDL